MILNAFASTRRATGKAKEKAGSHPKNDGSIQASGRAAPHHEAIASCAETLSEAWTGSRSMPDSSTNAYSRSEEIEDTTMAKAQAKPGKLLLSPPDHTLMLIDFQPQMAFATNSIDPVQLRNNATLIAKAGKEFKVSTILTTVAAKSFSGPIFPEIREVFPQDLVIDRTSMNSWEDSQITDRVNKIGKDRLVMAGLWTGVCITGPALSALDQGFEVYVISDASGDVSAEAHERAMERMVQAGVRPMTSVQYLLELQRDWARQETYDETVATAITHAGGYGLGLIYAKSMFGASEGH
jgi:nicotinamidase-related amidase